MHPVLLQEQRFLLMEDIRQFNNEPWPRLSKHDVKVSVLLAMIGAAILVIAIGWFVAAGTFRWRGANDSSQLETFSGNSCGGRETEVVRNRPEEFWKV
jgi:hypothetical protein